MAAGFVSVPVVPTFKGMSKEFSERLEKPAKEAGDRAGKAISDSLGDSVENLERQVKASSGKLKKLDSEYERSAAKQAAQKEKVQAATLKLEAAEEKYQQALAKGDKGLAELAKVKDAKARLIGETDKLKQAEIEVRAAEEKHKDQLSDLNSTLGKLKDSQADLNRELELADGKYNGMRGRLESLGESAKSAAGKFNDFAQKYKVHASAVLGGISLMGKETMEYASEAEQSYGAVESIFGEHAQGIIDNSKKAAEAVGLSGREYRELSSSLGAMLGNMGMPMDEVAGKSQDLVGVAADLAATFGGSTADAVESVSALLRGETDPIEKYGVSIKQADVNARLAAKGLDDLEGEALKQAQAQELLGLLTEQTADAQGQFNREVDTAAHKQQVATAKYNDAKEAIGTALLPIFAELADKLAVVAEIAGKHPRIFIAVAGAIATAAGAVVAAAVVAPILQAWATAAAAADTSMFGLAKSTIKAVAPILGIVAVVAAAGVALWAFFTKTETGRELWKKLVDAFKDGWEWLSGTFAAGWDWLKDKIGEFFDWFSGAFQGMKDLLIGGDFTSAFREAFGVEEDSKVVDWILRIRDAFISVWDVLKQIPELASGIWDILFKGEYTGLPFGLEEDSPVVDVLFNIRDAAGAVWDVLKKVGDMVSSSLSGTFSALWDTIKVMADAFWDVGKAVGGAVLDALGALWEVVKSLWDALTDLWEVLAPLILPVLKWIGIIVGGTLIGVFLGLVKAIEIVAGIISVLANVMSWFIENVVVRLINWIGNLIEFMGPILGAVLEGAIGIFTWFVDQFKSMWPTVQEYWDTFVNAIQWAWDNILKPTWDAMVTFLTDTVWPGIKKVIDWIQDAWQTLSDGMSSVWSWLRDNVLDPMGRFFLDTLWPAISDVLGWIHDRFKEVADFLGDVVSWIWDNVIMREINGWKTLWGYFSDIMGWIWDKFKWLAEGLWNIVQWIWDNVIMGFIRGLQNLWDMVVNVATWITDKWRWMSDVLSSVKDWIVENVFNRLGQALDTLKEWFRSGVDRIRDIWDGLKAAAAKPVRFVIDTVWNNGLRKAWNKIADLIPGIDPMDPVALGGLGAYAHGGVLPGYTPGRDVHDFYSPSAGWLHLSGGEAIMRPEWTRAVGGPAAVAKMNSDAKAGRLGEVSDKQLRENRKLLNAHQAFANGGVVEAMTSIILKKYPMMQMTSGYRPTNDNHGRGLAGDFSNGFANTPEMLSLANDIADTYPGSMELIHENPSFDRQIKNGAFVGGGGGSWGFYAGAGDHANHVHWAMNQPPNIDFGGGVFKGGSDGSGRGGFLSGIVKKIWDEITSPIKGLLDAAKGEWGDSAFAKIPGAALKHLMESVWSFISSKIPSGGSGPAADWTPGAGAEQWREMIVEAFKNQGEVPRPDLVDALVRQIDTESNGDPNIAQQIVDVNGTGESAGVGLSQVIPTTWQAYRDPSLTDNRRDPWAHTNFMVRYFRDRHNYDTGFVGQGHGWKDGGVLPSDLPSFLGLYDQGGWMPHGGVAVNQSGKPEPVFTNSQWSDISDMIHTLGDLVPAVRDQTKAIEKATTNAQDWFAKAGDYNSIEGINARQGVRRFLDLGLDIPGAEVITQVLDVEDSLWDSRERAVGHVENLVEKEKALEEARQAVADLADAPEGVSEDDQKKIDEAEKKLEEAKAKQAEADSDEKRAKAAEKVQEAEEKLRDTREQVDENTEESARKHADEVTKANDQVTKAEKDLAEARKAQAADLDNIVLLSQQQITGFIPQAEGFAQSLIKMGAPAAAVTSGLGGVTGALQSLASWTGPAGFTLGMAFDLIKGVIGIIKGIINVVKNLIEKMRKAREEARKAYVEAWDTIAEYASLVEDIHTNISKLQQSIVRGMNDQRDAEFKLRVAEQDRMVAQAEGMLKVAEARMELDATIAAGAKAAQLKMMGLYEDWDSYLSYEALAAKGTLEQWSDAAISAFFEYEATRAKALQGELQARAQQLRAEADLAKVTRENARNQQDLLKAQERLIRMSADVAGVDLVDATGTQSVAKIMVEMAETQQAMRKNWLGIFGFGSAGAERRGQQKKLDSLQQALDAVIAETGVNIDRGNLNKTLSMMASSSMRGGDPLAVLRDRMPELAQAETSLKINEALKPVWDARDKRDETERQVEDLRADIDLYDKVTPLDETIKALDYTIKGLQQSSQAWADGNEEVRGDYIRASEANRRAAENLGVDWKFDRKYATRPVRDQIDREVHIHMDGKKVYDADEVEKMISEITNGSGTKAVIHRKASDVAAARRGVRV